MSSRKFPSEDYLLRWPRELFGARLSDLVNADLRGEPYSDWSERVELVLEDAFEGDRALEDFKTVAAAEIKAIDPWSLPAVAVAKPSAPGRSHLIALLRAAEDFVYEVPRRPYRSQRSGGNPSTASLELSTQTVVYSFIKLVHGLENRGYFEKAFGKDCVDDPAVVDISGLIEREIGAKDIWPLEAEELATNDDLFLDLVEVLGEFVSAPQSRTFHSYGRCGWHHSNFDRAYGRDLYYWLANRLLTRTSFGLQLATSGEDQGRLVEVTGDARNDLIQDTLDGADRATRGPIETAVSLFRRRGATVEDKRSACIALAGVLESRRALLKTTLYRKDEGALFQIANEFEVRHRNASQRPDYDPAFLDWIFWWYLGTIELIDRIIKRDGAAPL